MARARDLIAAGLVAALARGAVAQSTTDSSVAPPPAHRLLVNAATLRPGQFVYQMTLEQDASTTMLGMRTVTAQRTMYAGIPAWMLAETRTTNAVRSADTVYADLTTLAALHWSSTIGEARLAIEFRGDSAYGGTTSPAGRRSMQAVAPAGSLVSSAMLETELRLLPLHVGWEDSTTTLSITLNHNSVLPTRMSVIGEDRLQLPSGTYDCWVVSVHADPARGLYWVTKRDPIVVKSSLDVPGLSGHAELVSVLVRGQ